MTDTNNIVPFKRPPKKVDVTTPASDALRVRLDAINARLNRINQLMADIKSLSAAAENRNDH